MDSDEGGVAGCFSRNMIFPNLATKTKGTFVKQNRKLVWQTARPFLVAVGRPPKSLDPRILGTRGGPFREEINLKVAGGYFGGEDHRALQGWAGSGRALDLRLGPSETAHQSGGGRVWEVTWRAAPCTITAGREVGWSVLGAGFRGYVVLQKWECVQREDALRSTPRRAEARSASGLRERILVEGTCELLGPESWTFYSSPRIPSFYSTGTYIAAPRPGFHVRQIPRPGDLALLVKSCCQLAF